MKLRYLGPLVVLWDGRKIEGPVVVDDLTDAQASELLARDAANWKRVDRTPAAPEGKG